MCWWMVYGWPYCISSRRVLFCINYTWTFIRNYKNHAQIKVTVLNIKTHRELNCRQFLNPVLSLTTSENVGASQSLFQQCYTSSETILCIGVCNIACALHVFILKMKFVVSTRHSHCSSAFSDAKYNKNFLPLSMTHEIIAVWSQTHQFQVLL